MSKCELCGEPMPPGEEMFKYHGYSGNCPKPPLEKKSITVQIVHRDTRDGELWMDVEVNGLPYDNLGPFTSVSARQQANDDLLAMLKSVQPH